MLTKTDRCKHKHSCYENVVRSGYRTFMMMYGFKLFINNVFYITKPAKLVKNLVSAKSQTDNLRFALFFVAMNVVYKLVLCICRRYFKDDKVGSALGGFLAGLCCYIDVKKRR